MERNEQSMYNDVFENIHLQKMQDKLCHVGKVFGCCYNKTGQRITKLSGQEQDLELLGSYFMQEQWLSLSQRIRESEMEELLVEDTPYPWLKIAAVDIKTELESSIVWVFAAVLTDEADNVPEFVFSTDRKSFYSFLDLVVQVNRMLAGHYASKVSAEAESRRNKSSEQEMSQMLRRLSATTEIVQLLDRDDAIETIYGEFLKIIGKYMMISSAKIYKITKDMEYAEIVSDWYTEGLSADRRATLDRVFCGGKLIDKPYIASSNTVVEPDVRDMMYERGVKATAVFPIMLNGKVGMTVLFSEERKERSWSVEDIRFMNDAVKVLQSITTKRIQKHSLASSYASLEAILDNVGSGIYVVDSETGDILFVNRYVRNSFPKELEAGVLDIVFGVKRLPDKESGNYEVHYFERSSWYDFYYTNLVWMDGRKVWLCSLYEVSDKKKYQQKIEQQAYTDFLTGLYNRMCCERDLARFVDTAKKNNTHGILLYLDLDDFKHINDGLGHQYGDVLLRSIAHSVQRVTGIADTCYRMGGDEFVIVIPPEYYDNCDEIIEKIKDIFNKPWFLKDADYYCTMSMGVVTFPDDGDNVEDLIKKADISMYDAKKRGKNRVMRYSSDISESSYMRLDMEKNMRDATVKGCDEFEVYYQPIIDVAEAGSPCTGAEALVRWNSDEMGFVAPSDFIPLAEYLGLINPIGNHILEQACKDCKRWNDAGHTHYKVNVNLSVIQLLQPNIVDVVRNAINVSGINPHNLTLEVTESLAINDMRRMKLVLGKIKKLGVRIALDDFGTGYSSLSHIREIPLDVIKVDQSFVKGLAEDSYSQAFVKMIAELADTIGVQVCVEGIETEAQYKVLEGMNVRMIQGYYFDMPMKREDFEKKYIERSV
ncbi:MAG: bifunctional diguanylate cyclase/phosphodiesterase [Lachnospiraceae bacterium]|nr:bifunctional diguanylate cyclase/phosphodiesterase [Lachnospiraceae bacterium]